MKSLKFFLLFFFPGFLVCLKGFSQENILPVKSFETRASHFRTDHLGKSFLITGNNLTCYDSIGNSLFQFRQTTSGKLGGADVTNPLKPLLFFPEFFEVIFLDSRLNFQNSVNLREAGIMQPLVVCMSSRGGFWVYDHQDFQLKYMAENLNVQFESGNLAQVTGLTVFPQQMLESESVVVLNDPGTGILVFDIFGNYIKTIPLKNGRMMQVIKQEIILIVDEKITGISIETGEPREILLKGIATDEIIEIQFLKNMIYILRKGKFEIYSFGG